MRGEGGVAGEGRLFGVPKFHSWDKCTMLLTNIYSDWMSNISSVLVLYCIILFYYRFSFWGVILPSDVLRELVNILALMLKCY